MMIAAKEATGNQRKTTRRRVTPARTDIFPNGKAYAMDRSRVTSSPPSASKEEQTMNRTLTTLAAGVLALALIGPAYAETSAPAPSSTPGVTHAKSPVGKVAPKNVKHGKKGTQKKQNSTTAPAPAPATH
jgi:hypothetical protein